tara:strand:+ start:239 stop:523 length:285 start_codon:yes stop_codon:yes gene_type:complete
MPRRKTPKQEHIIEMVLESQRQEKEAFKAYHDAQDRHLETLRKAREMGETCENLASALGVTKQWVHKYTKHGRDHNNVYKADNKVSKPAFSKWG